MAADQIQRQEMTVGPPRPFAVERFAVDGIDGEEQPQAAAGTAPFELITPIAYRHLTADITGLGFGFPQPAPLEHFRNTIVHLPAGMVGDPTATAEKCTGARLAEADPRSPGLRTTNCPEDSQVGTVEIVNGETTNIVALYNMVPPPGYPAAFGFSYSAITIVLLAKLRPDNGVDIVARTSPSSLPIPEVDTTFWGIPYDHRHDYLRHLCMDGFQGNFGGKQCPTTAPPQRFLRLPTSCPGSELPWSMEVDTYEQPGNFRKAQTTSPATTDCDALPFDPGFSVAPSLSNAHTPTGLDAILSLPQDSTPGGLAEADLRRAEVIMPQGMSINPAAAEGLAGCSDGHLGMGQEGPSSCPDASKLGTVELQSPLLDHSLQGSVFLRSQGSGTPESGDLYRLALEVRSDEDGIAIKLPGSLKADPNTGQLTTVFDNLPQLPFEATALHLKAGPRAPLLLPQTCATYTTHAQLTSWSGKTVAIDSPFKVDKGCDSPAFAPGFEAGVRSNQAGSYSPLHLRITRDAGSPNIARIQTTLPEGELAKFAGVTLCPEAGMQSGNCPANSKIGTATAGVGDGPAALFLPQANKKPISVYVGGPYKSAPYSVLVAAPAQAGPFDLGTVLVRSEVKVDPDTVRAEILSDPLPQVFAGIPVTYRDVRIDVDRPNFAINPTDCEPSALSGVISSSQGQAVAVSAPFQVADCAALAFKPKLSLKLRGEVSRGSHPRLISTLKARPGDANIARAQVKLPPSAFLDQSHIGTVCTRVQFAAGACPARSIYGKASATSPLLDYPIHGNVYLRSSSHQLPDLVVDLKGPATTPIEVALAGKTDSVKGALRTTFEAVPDAPVGGFRLELFGGKRGLIEMSNGFCQNPKAAMSFTAQNAKSLEQSPEVAATDCNKAKAHAKRHSHRGGGR